MLTATLLDPERDLLLDLLRTPTAGPLETGPLAPPPRLWECQRAYAAAAAGLGFVPAHHAAPTPEEVGGDDVPLAVRRAICDVPGFLQEQPSLVLRLGAPRRRSETLMFNVHLDTVAGAPPPSFDGVRFHGRGAIDAKGPAVALLAGIRTAIQAEPWIARAVTVLIQVVSGEEGGAMGTIGTRPLVRRGFVGRVNVFCEPTGGRYLARASAASTARVCIEGRDSIDDRPGGGHNATVLLGFLAQHLALALSPHALSSQAMGTVCIGGIHTGALHNRVYGTGELLVNIAYPSPDAGRRLELALEGELGDGLARFRRQFSQVPAFALTAVDAVSVTRLEWLKHGLPTLTSNDAWCEALLEDGAGVARWRDDEPAFSCDAIWMHDVPGTFTAVLGPGDLVANHAHGPGEFADLTDLEDFASAVARLVVSFARAKVPNGEGPP